MEEADLYLGRLFLPWRRIAGKLVVATADTAAENLAWLKAAYPGAAIVPVAKRLLLASLTERFGAHLLDRAVNSLWRATPRLSARRVVTPGQAMLLLVVGGALTAALVSAPLSVLYGLIVTASGGFLASIMFRTVLAWAGSAQTEQAEAESDTTLPVYTILVPLYREARVVPRLVAALRALDYPRDKLDIKLIVEADDPETVAAAAAHQDGMFELIAVPPGEPRTKPRACSFALAFARGEYLVIYDAEDSPEPLQLRKSVAGFRNLPRRFACQQARLNFYNAGRNWLTRMFALDYALWFDMLLPGLDRLGVPVPLGGTSNHFRTAVLREIGGWDPFNVTEDADIGIRLAHFGYRVAMLDSTTFEEAPITIRAWLKQRSRWLKGYMQTWLVHMRNPAAFVRGAGVCGVAAFHLFIGGAVVSALVNPLLWAVLILSLFVPMPEFGNTAGRLVSELSGTLFLLSNMALASLAFAASRRRGWTDLAPYGLTVVAYWMLISVAAYRGLAELVRRPFHWDKTEHGLSPESRA